MPLQPRVKLSKDNIENVMSTLFEGTLDKQDLQLVLLYVIADRLVRLTEVTVPNYPGVDLS